MSLSSGKYAPSAPAKPGASCPVPLQVATAVPVESSTAIQSDRVNPKLILSLQVDDRGFVEEADRDYYFRLIRGRLENRQCFDCHNRNPTWVSIAFGIFLCLTCSGNHRRLGTHITFVRSCELDNFTPEQLLRLERTGNGSAIRFLKSHGCERFEYGSKLATRYKHDLDRQLQAVTAAAAAPTVGRNSTALATETPGETRAELRVAELRGGGRVMGNSQAPVKLPVQLHYSIDNTPGSVIDCQSSSSRSGSDCGASSVGATGILSSAAGSQDSASCGPSSDAAQEDLLLSGFGGPLTASAIGTLPAGELNNGNARIAPVRTAPTASISATGVAPSSANVGQWKTKKLDIDFDFDAVKREAFGLQLLQKQQLDSNPGREADPGSGAARRGSDFGGRISYQSGTGASVAAQVLEGQRATTQSLSAPSQSFLNSKAISSQEYFRRSDNLQAGGGGSTGGCADLQTRIHRFKDCNAISSDAFLADDPNSISALQLKGIHSDEIRDPSVTSPNGTAAQFIDEETMARLSQIGDQAQQRIKVLAAGAQETMSRAKGWIASLIFDDHATGRL